MTILRIIIYIYTILHIIDYIYIFKYINKCRNCMKIHNLVINIFADNFHVKFPSSLSRSQMGRLLRIDED